MKHGPSCSICGATEKIVEDHGRWLCERHHAELVNRRETYAAEYSIYEMVKKYPVGNIVPMPPESNMRGAVLVKSPPVAKGRKVQPPQEVVIIFILHPTGIGEAVFENGELIHRKTYFPGPSSRADR